MTAVSCEHTSTTLLAPRGTHTEHIYMFQHNYIHVVGQTSGAGVAGLPGGHDRCDTNVLGVLIKTPAVDTGRRLDQCSREDMQRAYT